MKISYNWLKEYININLSPEDISNILTNIGLEVEGMEEFQSIKGGLEGFVIGEVVECRKHPNADKLSVTKVNVGDAELLDIVCGAPNVAAGQKVVVAKVGTKILTAETPFEIKKAKIRGEVSEGMICAEDEIGIGTSHDGIMVLNEDATVGSLASDYFKVESDTVFEIGLTPNRIDGASHYGVARDLSAYLNQFKPTKVSLPDVAHFKIDNNSYFVDVIIENKEAGPRYAGLTISGVNISPSPEWMQNKLRAIGLHPINNVVDITNYVLHETGHPLHAFDADKIKGKKIIVKNLPEGTKFRTLDNIDRTLSGEDLIICNEVEPMALAGVFGGIDSGVADDTVNVFLESAYFNPVSVRKTAKRHMLSTDASFRFERGADPNMVLFALKRAATLIKEIAGGSISSDIVDNYPNPVKEIVFEVNYENILALIGKDIEREYIKNILKSLDIEILKDTDKGHEIKVPAYRVDVQREADVTEEILRIYGYNNIEISKKLNSTINYTPKPNREKLIAELSNYLSNNGFSEIMTNSLTRSAYYENNKEYPVEQLVKIFNPLSSDLNSMRQNLLFGGLETILYNLNRKSNNLKLYEVGNCYFVNKNTNSEKPLAKYQEKLHLGIFMTGLMEEPNWFTKREDTTFFHLKTYLLNTLHKLGISEDKFTFSDVANGIFEYGLSLSINDQVAATLGKVSGNLCNSFEIDQDVYSADLNLDMFFELIKDGGIVYGPIPKTPEVKRDLALVIDKQIRYSEIRDIAYKTERKLLKTLNLFDVYEGDKIENGKKSYAVSFILQDNEKTLTDKQIDKVMNNLISNFKKQLGATIRQ